MIDLHRISSAATLSRHKDTTQIDQELIDQKAQDARDSARKRDIHVLHTGDEDTLQRMLNAMQPGTYVTPHRHIATPKAESVMVLQGSLGFVRFADDGSCDEQHFVHIDPKQHVYGVDYRAGVWHMFIALEPDTVVFEVKPGPYEATTDKEFAPWAPAEGDAEAADYLRALEERFRAHFSLDR